MKTVKFYHRKNKYSTSFFKKLLNYFENESEEIFEEKGSAIIFFPYWIQNDYNKIIKKKLFEQEFLLFRVK